MRRSRVRQGCTAVTVPGQTRSRKRPLPHGRPRRNVRRMSRIVGLTGGIACGKSAVATLLSARGALVIDADQIARDVVVPGSPALAELVGAFGPGILTPDAALDRPRLATLVFSDASARQTVERITHPRIAEESARRLMAAVASEPPLVVYDAALLFESGRAAVFRPIIVVAASPERQQARLERRDGLAADAARARIAAQMPVEEKVSRADFVIRNDDSLEALEAAVSALWPSLLADPPPPVGP